jgi:hypothetical protein
MSHRGVYFALLPEDVERLRAVRSDQELLSVIQDDIEERWDETWLFQTDKDWAGIAASRIPSSPRRSRRRALESDRR